MTTKESRWGRVAFKKGTGYNLCSRGFNETTCFVRPRGIILPEGPTSCTKVRDPVWLSTAQKATSGLAFSSSGTMDLSTMDVTRRMVYDSEGSEGLNWVGQSLEKRYKIFDFLST